MFLEKLRVQGWLDLFTNTQIGCSISELAEFYANCVVTNGVVTSIVGGHRIWFDTADLVEMLGVPSDGFDVYVHEDKNVLGEERLLEVTRNLAQNPQLTMSRSVRKGGNDIFTSLVILVYNQECHSSGSGAKFD